MAVLAFFGSLLSSHRVLVHAKERELNAVRGKLSAMYAELWRRSEMSKAHSTVPPDHANYSGRADDEDTTSMSCIPTWPGYERRIAQAQEWPYTSSTLGGLFASALLPVFVTVIQPLILL